MIARLLPLATLILIGLICLQLVPGPLGAQESAPAATQEVAKPAAEATGTHVVKVEPWKIEVELSGVFESGESWPVSLSPNSWASFNVLKAVEHGTRVERGEPLVWLEMKQIDEKLHDMEVALELAKLSQQLADIDFELLKTTMPMDLELAARGKRIADEEMNYFLKTNRSFLEESAQFSLKSARDSLEYAEEELKQLQKMYDADDLTEETEEIILRRARNDVARSRFSVKGSELRTARTLEQDLPRQEQQLVETAQRAELAMAKTRATLPLQFEKQQIEREKQRVETKRAEQRLQELREDRQMMEVKSPADGIVYYGQATRGKWSGAETMASQLRAGGKLMPQTVFMTVVASSPLHIRVDVPEQHLHQVRKGMRGTAIPAGYPDMELAAEVERIAQYPAGGGIFDGQLRVTLPEEANVIVPGMNCKLTIVAYEKKDAITVPAAAVFEHAESGQRNLVYVKSGDAAEARQVVVGKKSPQKWEIVSGLQAGEEILLKRPNGAN